MPKNFTNMHDDRATVRSLTYPNRATEDAAIARVDDEVFDKVREFETSMVFAADQFETRAYEQISAALEVKKALTTELRHPLRSGQLTPSKDTARQYKRLRSDLENAIAALERADREAEWHQNRLRDPELAHKTLLSKFPILNRPIL